MTANTSSATRLSSRVLEILKQERAPEGFRIREQWLADALGVSRSPVRQALQQLESLNVVQSQHKKGYYLRVATSSPEFDQIVLPQDDTDRIYRLIASERFANLIGDQVSVGDLVKRYGMNRSVIHRVLARMQEDGLVEKTPGHGWQFGPALNDEASYQDSYRFRLLVEPSALLQDSFSLTDDQLNHLRRIHLLPLEQGLDRESISNLFEIDAEFHNSLANACGNRFLAQAIRQQTRLRRLSEYEKYTSRDRLEVSFTEHLAILDAIGNGAMAEAAERMSLHIRMSDATRPDFRKVRVLAHRRLTRR